MPRPGDRIAYFFLPLGEHLPLDPGPYSPDPDSPIWDADSMRPSQTGLPKPSQDVSILLYDGEVAKDDGLWMTTNIAIQAWKAMGGESSRGALVDSTDGQP